MAASTRAHVRAVPLLALVALLLTVPGRALARAPLHPAVFALAPGSFPAGSHVVRASIETNRQLRADQPLHFGLTPAAMGRLTGYYTDAIEGDAGSPHAYTSYLVSIFRTPKLAERAREVRWQTWFGSTYYTTPPPAPIVVGASGTEALFRTLDPTAPPESELLFRRGAVLVEVLQGSPSAALTGDQIHSFWTIATQLDALAQQHPRGT